MTKRPLSIGLLSIALAAGVLSPLAMTGAATAATTVAFASTLAGPSRAAMYPSGMEYDAVNNRLVVADTGRDRVLFYSLTGTKLGGFGDYGDGNGLFKSPRDVAVDEAGNIYVADAENHRIQKFTSTGDFLWKTPGLGSWTCNECLNTPIGVTWDAANDVLLVASTGQNRIKAFFGNGVFAWKSPIIGGDSATVPVANKSTAPRDVTRGPDGNLWVTAYYEHQIKVYDVPADGSLWTDSTPVVAVVGSGNGTGDGQMNFPYNVVFSSDGGTAYVSDTGNGRITVWDIADGSPSWVGQIGDHCTVHPQPCPDPPAGTGTFNHLRRVVIDPAGNLYGADFWGGGIEVFDAAGTSIRSIEGMEPPAPGFAEPYGVDVAPNGQVYVMDRLNHRIERFTAQGAYVNKVGARGASGGTFSWPEAITVAPNGAVWAVDTRGDNIQRLPSDLILGTPLPTRIGGTGSTVGKFNYPEGADVDSSGVVWVADTRNDRLQTYNPANGNFSVVGSSGVGPGQLKSPMGVAVTNDAVYVADTANNRVQKLSLTGQYLGSSTPGLLLGPEGIEVAPDGTVWVADTGNSRIVHLSSSLTELGDSFGSPGNGDLQFNFPHDVAFGNGLLYVADTYNDRVQTFTVGDAPPPPPTFEPTYASQLSAAGGVAPLYPAGVAVAGDGTWFVADSGGSRVATVDPATGATATVNATAFTDPRDLELDATDQSSLWVTNTGKNTILKISRTGTVQATLGGTGSLNQPYGLTNDASRVYVANTYGGNVKAFNKNGTTAWTQATCFGKAFLRPRDVGLADNGNVLVADTDNARIVVLDSTNGSCISAFGSSGTTVGKFKSPRSVTADGTGGVWVADALNYRIQHLTMAGLPIGANAATPLDAYGDANDQYRSPHCIARIPGSSRIAVCDTFNYRVKTYTVSGDGSPTLDTIVGGQRPTAGGFNGPFAVAYGPSGELYVADWFNHRIQKFNPDGSFDRQWGGYGPKDGSLIFPRGVVVAPNGDVVVTDSENNRIDVFDSSGVFKSKIKPPTGALQLARPHQTALDGSGGYWVADTNNSRIVRLSAAGVVLSSFTIGGKPQGIAVDTDGTLLVSNTTSNSVLRYNTSGVLQGTVAGSATVKAPSALLVTGTGSDKKIWITDTGNHRVVVLGSNGAVLKTFGGLGSGDGKFNTPRGVAVDPTDGDIAVADYLGNRISLWEPTGPPPVGDTANPTLSISAPSAGGTSPSPLTIAGLASDDLQVSSVTLSIKRTSDNFWWNGSSWQSTFASVGATLSMPNTASTSWSYVLSAAPGKYGFSATVTDGAGKTLKSTWRNFTISP